MIAGPAEPTRMWEDNCQTGVDKAKDKAYPGSHSWKKLLLGGTFFHTSEASALRLRAVWKTAVDATIIPNQLKCAWDFRAGVTFSF